MVEVVEYRRDSVVARELHERYRRRGLKECPACGVKFR